MRTATAIIYLVLLVGIAPAGFVHNWRGDVGNPANQLSFCDQNGWDTGLLPGAADTVFVDCPPALGPVVDCDITINSMYGPKVYSDCNQVMDLVSGNFTVDVWQLAQTGTGKATINIGGTANVTVGAGSNYEFGGIQGPKSGDVEINITDDAVFTVKYAEKPLRLGTDQDTTSVLNISGNAYVLGEAADEWQLADQGTVIVNISENATLNIRNKWRNCDQSEGYIEIHMSGGSLSVGESLSVRDDGSAIFDFSGGTVKTGGIPFKGRADGSWCKINISGSADVTNWGDMILSENNGPSTLNISGGRLETDGLRMANGATATCTLNMTGGELFVGGTITAPGGETAIANINLHGGTIECGQYAADPFAHYGDNWSLDVCNDGVMIIEGDVKTEIAADIAAGKITACGGPGAYSVDVDYNNANPGKTTISVTPAPCKGDANRDLAVNTDDLNLLVVHLFQNGVGPKFEAPLQPYPLADIDGSGKLDTDDLNLLVVHLFQNGSGPKFDAPCM